MESGKVNQQASKQFSGNIAIIGMAGFFPKASDLKTYWQNIVGSVNCIDEIPSQRWDWQLYYHPDYKMKDKIISKWGAFLPDVLFDPLKFGIPPKTLEHIEIVQLLMLESTRLALSDSGYEDRPFDRKRTAIYIGTGAGEEDIGQHYSFRSLMPRFFGESSSEILTGLDGNVPEWSEDSFTGILPNIIAGRVANRFDLGGANCTIDAACASSLAALRAGILDLKAGESDMVIVGGADTLMSPFVYNCFTNVGALSPTGKSIPFDQDANGIVLGETVAAIILKRLEDAQKDRDKIYAVIKGMSASSDGKAKGLTAPRQEGQILALERAYENAGIDPATVGLIEAHGTGTVLGDQTEAKALKQFFGLEGRREKTCAVGSVKSMVGHSKCAAGIASIIKTAMALDQKVLPPTLGIKNPMPILNEPGNALYLNTQTRPWISEKGYPRRAGVNSFGFGGTNFHAILEEYVDNNPAAQPMKSHLPDWDAELFVLKGENRSDIINHIESLEKALSSDVDIPLKDLAFTATNGKASSGRACLAIVADSLADLKKKLQNARLHLTDTKDQEIWNTSGIYYSEVPLKKTQKIAFVFPGQGSQYTGMLTDLAIQYDQVRESFERFDTHLADQLPKPLSAYIFPPNAFSPEVKKADEIALTATNVAQPAMGNANLAMLNLLLDFGLKPDMTAGHSYGEYVALFASGVMDEEALAKISEARGRFILEAAQPDPGTMAAVRASEKEVAALIADIPEVWIANLNSPKQTVISGSKAGITQAIEKLKQNKISAQSIPVACAFHTPIVSSAKDNLKAFFSKFTFNSPQMPVFSNTTTGKFPSKADEIQDLLTEQLVSPVRFVDQINAMYDNGARIFVEVGAGNVLSNLIDKILNKKDHKAIFTDKKGHTGLKQLQHALAKLAALGLDLNFDKLYVNRKCRQLDLNQLISGEHPKSPSKTAYLIGSAGARPVAKIPPKTVTPRPICFQDKVKPENTHKPDLKIETMAQNQGETLIDYSGGDMSHLKQQPNQNVRVHHNTTNDAVINKFQDLMSQFLETQKEVMLAYLNGGDSNFQFIGNETTINTDQTANSFDTAFQDIPHPDILQENATELLSESIHAVVTPEPEVSPAPIQPESAMATAEEPSVDGANKASFDIKSTLLQIVSDRTGYPEDMLELDLEIQADLGIDSIKRIQIFEELEAALKKHNLQMPDEGVENLVESFTLGDIITTLKSFISDTSSSENNSQSADGDSNVLDIKSTLLNIVSDLCGYPTETLELDLEIEADLGIDSIKRVQIMEHLETALDNTGFSVPDEEREKLAESMTLGDIIEKLTALGQRSSSVNQSPEKQPEFSEQSKTQEINEDKTAPKEESSDTTIAATAPVEHEKITTLLYDIIEKQTGYPKEVLEPDLNLLTDLEIDAQRRDEILDVLLNCIVDVHGYKLTPDQQKSNKIHLLNDIVDWVAEALVETSSIDMDHKVAYTTTQCMDNPQPSTRRFVLTTKNRPLIYNPKSYFKQHGVIITGTADCSLTNGVNKKLKSMGYKTLILEHAHEPRDPEEDRYFADLTDFHQLEKNIQTARENYGKMTSIIHLAPISDKKSFKQMALSGWKHQLALETKSLFYLTKILADDLAEAAHKGESSIVAATAMGDIFASMGSEEKTPKFFPGNGGVSGFLKALAGEIPGINTRTLDLDPDADIETHIDQIITEFSTPSADIEVGYRSSQRLILDIQEAFLDPEKATSESIRIDKSSVLLVTGGGRGITSHIALELARRYQPTILLVGRTPLDDDVETDETAGITDEKQLKALVAERLKAQQAKVKPMDIEKVYTRLVRQREIRQSLDQLQEAGASACYFSTDVTDESQMKRLMDLLYEEYDRIDGVIHGAGIIEDKMVRDKDIQSFDRVFDTKADSIFILSRVLRGDSLRFLALFSSVAGRFGNPGQSDYGAANEVYNKSALYLNRVWPGRVVSFIWGPWESGGGMVTEELRKKFDTSGIYMIPRDTGAQAFIEEITRGPKTDVEVIYGSWDDQKKNLMTTMKTERLPLFCINSNFSPPLNGTVELIRNLEVAKDIYLMDHKLDGQPVLPMAMAMEMMVEAVTYRYPDFQVRAVKDLKVYKGVILEKDQRHIRIIVNSNKTNDNEVLLKVQIRDAETDKQIYYEAMVELIKETQVHHPHVPIDLQESAPFSLSVAEAYDKQLFHGPLWHGIKSIETIGKNGIIGHLKTSRPENFIQGASSSHSWIIDPLLVDSGLQLILLWMRDQFDITPLPSKFKKYHRFTSEPAPETLRCEIQVNLNGNKGIKEAEIFFINPDGHLFGKIEGFEVIGSKALNRLSEK